MEIFIAILGALLVIVGLIGSFIPMIPGPPISFVGVLMLLFLPASTLTWKFFVFWGIVVTIFQILNYYIPAWGVSKFGGTKYGMWGSIIGALVFIFCSPINAIFGYFIGAILGVILGPFIGAVVGELIGGMKFKASLKAGFGSFIGTFVGMVLGIIVSAILTFYYFKEVFCMFF